jgi:SOS response regulatory protein OraA/RecX
MKWLEINSQSTDIDELRERLKALNEPKLTPEEVTAQKLQQELVERLNSLILMGYSMSESKAIMATETVEFKHIVTLDVASEMFGGGLKESRSAVYIPKR